MTQKSSEFKESCLALSGEVKQQGAELLHSADGCSVARLAAGEGKPWLSLRGKGRFVGNPFAPVLIEKQIDSLG
jgi:hypothetical protein